MLKKLLLISTFVAYGAQAAEQQINQPVLSDVAPLLQEQLKPVVINEQTQASLFSEVCAHPFIAALAVATGVSSIAIGVYFLRAIERYALPKTNKPQEEEEINTKNDQAENNQNNEPAPIFFETAQSEPWKTELEITAIAEGLEAVLKNDLTGQITNKEIELLQKETLEENDLISNTLSHTLMRQVTIPADAELYMHADLHGDTGPINAMLTHLENKKKFDPQTGKISGNAYVAFLGNYIGKGPNGLKNLWYLWQLKQRNPGRVFLIRGSEEGNTYLEFQIEIKNAIKGTLDKKIYEEKTDNLSEKFAKAFALLPVVTFIDREKTTHSRIALVHGGINPDDAKITGQFNKKSFVAIETIARQYLCSRLKDVDNNKEDTTLQYNGLSTNKILCKTDVKKWMKANNIAIIFHGHDQQSEKTYTDKEDKKIKLFKGGGKWRGVESHWDDNAIGLNIAANTNCFNQRNFFGGYDFYCDYGTFVCIKPKPADFVHAQPSTDSKFATNTVAQELTTLPDYILEPIYFLPKNPTTIVPNDQVLAKRRQDKYSDTDNLAKKQKEADGEDEDEDE